MRYYISLCALALVWASHNTTYAQQADTLKRQLRVLTEQDEHIEAREPMSLKHQLPQPPKAQVAQLTPVGMRPYIPDLSLSPLSALPPLQDLYDRNPKTAYIHLGGGLQYNAYLSTGLRLYEGAQEVWDLYLDGHYTRHKLINYNAERTIKEQALSLSSRYSKTFDNGLRLSAEGSFAHDKHNYYGYQSLAPTSTLGKVPTLKQNQIDLKLSIGPSQQKAHSLNYHLTPRLSYNLISGLSPHATDHKVNELHLGLDAQLRYILEQDHYIGVDLEAETYTYQQDKPNAPSNLYGITTAHSTWGYDNSSTIRLRPFWHYANSSTWDWGIRLGLGLDLYTQGKERGTVLSPFAEGYAKFNDNWAIRLDLGGGVRLNSLSQMLREMPYLYIGIGAKPSETNLSGRLSLDGLIRPDLKLSGFVGYALQRMALNYAVSEDLAFIPEHIQARTNEFSLGGQVEYRIASVCTLMGRATYKHWSKDHLGNANLYGRPNLVLESELRYRPLQTLECSIGAEIQRGIQHKVIGQTQPLRLEMPAMSLIRLAANYQIHKSWTLGANAQVFLDRAHSLYYGYLPQRFTANIGATYQF